MARLPTFTPARITAQVCADGCKRHSVQTTRRDRRSNGQNVEEKPLRRASAQSVQRIDNNVDRW
jgi:hypothetical protein